MSLRDEAIEAMARAIKPWIDVDVQVAPEEWHSLQAYRAREAAAPGLDALLGFLTEHADEWIVEAGREWCDYSHWISEPEDLLAVLGDTE